MGASGIDYLISSLEHSKALLEPRLGQSPLFHIQIYKASYLDIVSKKKSRCRTKPLFQLHRNPKPALETASEYPANRTACPTGKVRLSMTALPAAQLPLFCKRTIHCSPVSYILTASLISDFHSSNFYQAHPVQRESSFTLNPPCLPSL